MKVSNSILIESTLEEVWKKTIDIEAWPSWNPIMNIVTKQEDGELAVGSRVRIEQNGMNPAIWTVQELKEKEFFSWKTNVSGIKMCASHEISSHGNSIQNTLTINVEGIIGFLLWPFLKKQLLKAIVNENNHFKVYCESRN